MRPKKRILLIDNSRQICSLIKEAVEKHSDFKLASLNDANELLDKMYVFQPDLLVLEAGLSDLDAFDFTRELRRGKRWEALPVILVTKKNSPDFMAEAYESGADDLLQKPFEPLELVLKIKAIFRRMSFTYELATTALEKKTIQALGRSVEVKDPYTEGHSARVAFFSVIIAKALFLSEQEMSIVEDAAYLHDLGKIGIHEQILNKGGPLSDDEWVIMCTHPEKSAVIIESLGFMPDLVPMVRGHHECYDGSGYPDKLKGEGISLGARVISVADSFDAMTSDRAFRKRRDMAYAMEELATNAGTQFDPQIAKIFATEIKKFPGIETLHNYSSAESLEMLRLVKG